MATFFLVMGGGVLYLDGFIFDNLLQVEANVFTETVQGRYFIAEFFGCLFAVGFMVSLLPRTLNLVTDSLCEVCWVCLNTGLDSSLECGTGI